MDPECADILKEAAGTRLRKESVERAIGRVVRRRNLDYRRYVEVVSALREFAEASKMSPDDALASFVGEGFSGQKKQ